jgi:hypothetical protein
MSHWNERGKQLFDEDARRRAELQAERERAYRKISEAAAIPGRERTLEIRKALHIEDYIRELYRDLWILGEIDGGSSLVFRFPTARAVLRWYEDTSSWIAEEGGRGHPTVCTDTGQRIIEEVETSLVVNVHTNRRGEANSYGNIRITGGNDEYVEILSLVPDLRNYVGASTSSSISALGGFVKKIPVRRGWFGSYSGREELKDALAQACYLRTQASAWPSDLEALAAQLMQSCGLQP